MLYHNPSNFFLSPLFSGTFWNLPTNLTSVAPSPFPRPQMENKGSGIWLLVKNPCVIFQAWQWCKLYLADQSGKGAFPTPDSVHCQCITISDGSCGSIWLVMLLHVFAFLAQAPLFLILFIWALQESLLRAPNWERRGEPWTHVPPLWVSTRYLSSPSPSSLPFPWPQSL